MPRRRDDGRSGNIGYGNIGYGRVDDCGERGFGGRQAEQVTAVLQDQVHHAEADHQAVVAEDQEVFDDTGHRERDGEDDRDDECRRIGREAAGRELDGDRGRGGR